jgi:hypothetical protein
VNFSPTSFRNDIALAIPKVLWAHKEYATDAEAFAEWALHIQSRDWTEDYNWPATIEYELLYSRVLDKAKWIGEVSRLLDLAAPFFVDFASCEQIFCKTYMWERQHLRSDMFSRAVRGAEQMRNWLSSKQKSAIEQFATDVTSLRFFREPLCENPIQASEFALHYSNHIEEEERFQVLYKSFETAIQEGIGSEGLRVLRHRLAKVRKFPVEELSAYKLDYEKNHSIIRELPDHYPQFIWNGIKNDSITPTVVTQEFWQALTYSVSLRGHYASLGYELVCVAAGVEIDDSTVIQSKPLRTSRGNYESSWEAILDPKMSLELFFDFLYECGLVTQTKTLTPLGAGKGFKKSGKAPWAGALRVLISKKLLSDNIAEVCKVLASDNGLIQITMNPGTLRNISKTAERNYVPQAEEALKSLKILS